MYHLKSVYGIIQLNSNQIILGVFQYESNHIQHCLYHKVINNLEVFNNNVLNIEAIHQVLNKELESVDIYMGLKVKRYLFVLEEIDLGFNQQIDCLANKLAIKNMGTISMVQAFKDVDTNHVLIDLKDNYSFLNEYDENHELIKSSKIEIGINYFKELINQQFNFPHAYENLKPFLVNFKNVRQLDETLSLFNFFPNQFLSLQQIKIKDFDYLIRKWFTNFLNQLASYLKPFTNKNIYCNCENEWQSVFDVIFSENGVLVNNQNINLFKTNVFGLENEFTNTLICCLKNTISERSKNNLQEICSIDAFVAEEITSRQIQKGLMMKFGIISTQISAKLGQGE